MNTINLFGRITAEPELKYTSGGNKFVRFVLAVDRRSKTKATDFIDCIAWNNIADVIVKYVHKGNQLSVTGALETNSYEKDGEKRKAYAVNAISIDLVSEKKSEAQPSSQPNETAVTADETAEPVDLPFNI